MKIQNYLERNQNTVSDTKAKHKIRKQTDDKIK